MFRVSKEKTSLIVENTAEKSGILPVPDNHSASQTYPGQITITRNKVAIQHIAPHLENINICNIYNDFRCLLLANRIHCMSLRAFDYMRKTTKEVKLYQTEHMDVFDWLHTSCGPIFSTDIVT